MDTVRKYLKSDTTTIHDLYGVKNDNGLLTAYVDKINEYISLKFKFKDIEVMIRNHGYAGSISLLRKYVSNFKADIKQQYEKAKCDNRKLFLLKEN